MVYIALFGVLPLGLVLLLLLCFGLSVRSVVTVVVAWLIGAVVIIAAFPAQFVWVLQ